MKAKVTKSKELSLVAHIDSIRNTVRTTMRNDRFATHPSLSEQEKKRLLKSRDEGIEEMTFISYTSWFFRVQNGWSQQEIAKACGISRSTLGRFEKGDTSVVWVIMLLVRVAMQITYKEFDEVMKQKIKEYKAQSAKLKAKKDTKR